MGLRARSRRTLAFAGLTPLVDVLFILLFALLALSDSRTTHQTEQVRVQLPEVEPADEGSLVAGERVQLEISAESTIRLAASGAVIRTREELDRELSAILGQRLPEEVVVEIQADRDARHGVAVELLQHIRLLGFVNVELIASGREGTRGPFGSGEGGIYEGGSGEGGSGGGGER